MITFAELDSNNVVTRVIVVSEANNADENGTQDENVGIAFCKKLYGEDTVWKQAAGKREAIGKGKIYHEDSDSFIFPQPYPSWVLNEILAWVAPVDEPEILSEEQIQLGYHYSWNEALYQDNPESASTDLWVLCTPQLIDITNEPNDTTVSIGSSAIIGIGVTINYGNIEYAAAEKCSIDENDPSIEYWSNWDGELFLEENSVRTGILTTSDFSGDYRIKFYGNLGGMSGLSTSFTLTVN